jgi:hypothetical protein
MAVSRWWILIGGLVACSDTRVEESSAAATTCTVEPDGDDAPGDGAVLAEMRVASEHALDDDTDSDACPLQVLLADNLPDVPNPENDVLIASLGRGVPRDPLAGIRAALAPLGDHRRTQYGYTVAATYHANVAPTVQADQIKLFAQTPTGTTHPIATLNRQNRGQWQMSGTAGFQNYAPRVQPVPQPQYLPYTPPAAPAQPAYPPGGVYTDYGQYMQAYSAYYKAYTGQDYPWPANIVAAAYNQGVPATPQPAMEVTVFVPVQVQYVAVPVQPVALVPAGTMWGIAAY